MFRIQNKGSRVPTLKKTLFGCNFTYRYILGVKVEYFAIEMCNLSDNYKNNELFNKIYKW